MKRSQFGLDLGLLILRLVLGGLFVFHGVGKFRSEAGVDGFIEFVASLGLPLLPAAAWAWAALAAEIGGGLLLVVGFLPRLAAASLVGLMVVAAVEVHAPNGFSMVSAQKLETIEKEWKKAGAEGELRVVPHGCEYNVVLGGMALALVCTGGGGIGVAGRKRSAPKS